MNKILDNTTRDLLNQFGKGQGMTGAGSIAALSALSGTQMLVSVCKLTTGKERYAEAQADVKEIQEQLENVYIPRLESILEDDIAVVKDMLRLRIQRDKETDEMKKQELKIQAQQALVQATDSMLSLTETCIDIIPMALHIYRRGLKSAQGDSGIALSNLLSAASSGLYATLKNIQSSKDKEWAASRYEKVETFYGRLHEYHHIFTGRLESIFKTAFN